MLTLPYADARLDDWVAEHTIRKPFLDLQFAHNYVSDINRQIVFRRPSWSPDGQTIVGQLRYLTLPFFFVLRC
jgi:hypothetical protein